MHIILIFGRPVPLTIMQNWNLSIRYRESLVYLTPFMLEWMAILRLHWLKPPENYEEVRGHKLPASTGTEGGKQMHDRSKSSPHIYHSGSALQHGPGRKSHSNLQSYIQLHKTRASLISRSRWRDKTKQVWRNLSIWKPKPKWIKTQKYMKKINITFV